MGGINLSVPIPHSGNTFGNIGKRMNRDPFVSAATTAVAPAARRRLPVVNLKKLLDTDGISGAHNGRNLMYIKNVLQNQGQIILAF